MDTDKPARPPSAAEARRDREAEALRANLRKRKDQQRARRVPPTPDAPPVTDDQASPPDPAAV